jgi:hypothetical protein
MMWTKSNVRDPVAILILEMQAQAPFQGANCDRTFVDGFLPQIRLRITILQLAFVIREQRVGSLKVISIGNGNQLVPYCGFMESVRSLYHFHPPTDHHDS